MLQATFDLTLKLGFCLLVLKGIWFLRSFGIGFILVLLKDTYFKIPFISPLSTKIENIIQNYKNTKNKIITEKSQNSVKPKFFLKVKTKNQLNVSLNVGVYNIPCCYYSKMYKYQTSR